jgi:tetratricopeptide (TPR) repeat protein
MLPEDLYLLGVALSRDGNRRGAREVWEQARSADPKHVPTLFELTRAYAAGDDVIAASKTGRILAAMPGSEAKAEALLGAIQLELDNPAGAIESWHRAGQNAAKGQGGDSTTIVPPKDLARALLQAGRSADARDVLKKVLAARPDPECFWLLSRAYLQERATIDALRAWEKSGSFRDENPLVPDPAPMVGSQACAKCHGAIYQAQHGSRHARTFFRASEVSGLELPSPSFVDPAQPSVTHTLKRTEDYRLELETHAAGQVYHAIVEYAFGSGDRGLTLVGRDQYGQARELRLSHYRVQNSSLWDVTSGHPAQPTELVEYLGQPLSEDAVRRCFLCHVTSLRVMRKASGPAARDHGIGCEKCHGPGGNHLLAVAADFPDLSIARPTMAAGARVVKLCAGCHSPRGRSTSPDDPHSARFQGTTLTWSRCFKESNDTLDCISCHDPHRNATTSTEHYESTCLSCHGGETRDLAASSRARRTDRPAPTARTVCPVNRSTGCVGCHMPPVKNVVPHSAFTDHFIRVHRE